MIGNRLLLAMRGFTCVLLLMPTLSAADALSDEDEARQKARQLAETGVHFDMEGATDYARYAWQAALRKDPECALARWRLGYVKTPQDWVSAAKASSETSDAELLASYHQRRDAADGSIRSELVLARWCRASAMNDRANVHFRRIADHPQASESERMDAIRELGLRRFGGQLMTDAQIRQMRQVMTQARHDLDHWTERLAKSIRQIKKGRQRVKLNAIEKLRAIDDPTAIPALELHLSTHDQTLAMEAVGIIAAMPYTEASESLVRHAVVADWPQVRRQAIVQLRRRSLHDFVPALLAGLRSPIRSVFQITPGPDGQILHEHLFFQEGADENLQLTLTNVAVPSRNGNRAASLLEQRQLRGRASRIQSNVIQRNVVMQQRNQRIYDVLRETTDELLESDPVAWWDWWKEYNEYEIVRAKPTRAYTQSSSYTYQTAMISTSHECFPAGTLIWTESGTAAIESLRAGDRVLSQDADSGELAYKVVTAATRRNKAPMQAVTIGDTRLTLTTGHPLWVHRKGWRMAKRLQLGDAIHTLSGAQQVMRLELAGEGEAYNLVVDGFGSYFVADIGILAHDNTYRSPTRAISPGLLAKN